MRQLKKSKHGELMTLDGTYISCPFSHSGETSRRCKDNCALYDEMEFVKPDQNELTRAYCCSTNDDHCIGILLKEDNEQEGE